MATALARRTAPTVRRGPSPMVAKLKNELAKTRARARARGAAGGAPSLMTDALVVVGAAGFGLAESKAVVPSRLGPVDTALVIGGVGALLIPRFVSGTPGRVVHDVTLGALAIASYKLGGGATFWESTPESGWDDVE